MNSPALVKKIGFILSLGLVAFVAATAPVAAQAPQSATSTMKIQLNNPSEQGWLQASLDRPAAKLAITLKRGNGPVRRFEFQDVQGTVSLAVHSGDTLLFASTAKAGIPNGAIKLSKGTTLESVRQALRDDMEFLARNRREFSGLGTFPEFVYFVATKDATVLNAYPFQSPGTRFTPQSNDGVYDFCYELAIFNWCGNMSIQDCMADYNNENGITGTYVLFGITREALSCYVQLLP